MKLQERLSEKVIDKLETDPTSDRLYFDSDQHGFGLRITKAGTRSFFYQYVINNRSRRITIGEYPAWTATLAREEANNLRVKIDTGVDPLIEKEQRRKAPTMTELCNDYLERHAKPHKRESSIRNDTAMIENVIKPKLGARKVADITIRDIETLHQAKRAKRYAANRLVALLSKMFALAIIWKWRSDNPCKGVQRFQEEQRTDWLNVEQLQRLGAALASYKDKRVANAFWLLVLTGARKNEVLKATWPQFDLERADWTLPAHFTKQKRIQHYPLSPNALILLTEMKAQSNGSQFLFPGDVDGKPLQDVKKAWATIRKEAGITVRIHDLRHTFGSHLASSNYSAPIIGKLMGHTNSKTTERYIHLANKPLREATAHMGSIVGPIPTR